MNIPVEQFGLTGATALGGLITAVTLWNKFQNKVENLEKTDKDQQTKIDGMDKWTHEFEKEAAHAREEFNRAISRLEGAQLVVNEQFKQIMSALQDIKERIEKLESK